MSIIVNLYEEGSILDTDITPNWARVADKHHHRGGDCYRLYPPYYYYLALAGDTVETCHNAILQFLDNTSVRLISIHLMY